jgi:hypothetical protein
MLAMTPKERFSRVSGPLLLFVLILPLASTASAEWNEKVLYSFQGIPDGAVPAGGVVFDKAGNLYGATGDGGASTCEGPGQCGTVYQLKPPAQKGGAWTETVLYIFKGHAQNDGATPEGGLVIDQAGNLYGTTGYGGSGPCLLLGAAVGCGTVYELSPPAKQGDPWKEKVLYSFQGGKDGFVASGDLVFDKAGNLYGATLFGGGKGTTCDSLYGGQCGTVFKLSPPKTKGGKWTEKVLHSFAGVQPGQEFGDGASPNGGLVLDSVGAVYGTTFNGGYNCPHRSDQGCGTVFQLKPPTKTRGWIEKQIHVFKNGDDGTQPSAGVVFGVDGLLYGGAGGGSKGGGIIFRLTPAANGPWKESILYELSSDTYGYDPSVAIFDCSGNLYGITADVPDSASGSVFRLKPPGRTGGTWVINFLYYFTGQPDGVSPNPYLIFDHGGDLYGTTQYGGEGTACQTGCGMVFEVRP